MTRLSTDQQAILDSTELLKGSHAAGQGYCLMELVAFLASEPHSDRPACACPVLAAFARKANDRAGYDDRQKLKELVPLLLGSKSTKEIERKRAYLFVDYAARKWEPRALRAAGRDADAARLEALAPITDQRTARAAAAAAAAAAADADAANAAYAAADAAVYAAYARVPIAEQIEAVRQAAMIGSELSEYPPAMNSKDTQEKA